jgi:septum formation topological specificity factor MinE
MEARAQGEAVQLILASVREELARTRRTLEQEQGRNAAQGEVLANTQAAFSETSASLAEVRAAMAEQTEAHANAQAAAQSDKQQWVERYWDMVKLHWAQTRQSEASAAALAALQAEVMEAQQRQWQAEQDTVSLRQELSQANGMAAKLRAQVGNSSATRRGKP